MAKEIEPELKKTLDECSEIFLWAAIEQLGGFLWRMNHDMADGRIQSTPDIEADMIMMGENQEYAIDQLARFGVPDPREGKRKEYMEWYKTWKDYWETVDKGIYDEINRRIKADSTDACQEYRPDGLTTAITTTDK